MWSTKTFNFSLITWINSCSFHFLHQVTNLFHFWTHQYRFSNINYLPSCFHGDVLTPSCKVIKVQNHTPSAATMTVPSPPPERALLFPRVILSRDIHRYKSPISQRTPHVWGRTSSILMYMLMKGSDSLFAFSFTSFFHLFKDHLNVKTSCRSWTQKL